MSLAPLLRRKRPTASQWCTMGPNVLWNCLIINFQIICILISNRISCYSFHPLKYAYKNILQIHTYLTTLQIRRFIRDFKKKKFGPVVQRQRAILKNCALKDDDARVSCHVCMLLTNKPIQKRHSAADLIFLSQIYFYLITMGCILMGNIPNFYLSLTENLYVFFATLPFPRQFFSACTCTRFTAKLF